MTWEEVQLAGGALVSPRLNGRWDGLGRQPSGAKCSVLFTGEPSCSTSADHPGGEVITPFALDLAVPKFKSNETNLRVAEPVDRNDPVQIRDGK